MTTDLYKKVTERALDWEYSNFNWRDYQELALKKLEALREVIIPNAFKSGYEQGAKDAEVLVAKNIFAGFCLSSRDTAEKEILCQVIDKLYPAIRLPKQEEQDD